MNGELIEAAFDYLDRGLSVIALSGKMPNGKVHKHGLHSAFTPDRRYVPETEVSVEGGMLASETTGVGILTGPVYYVVDIDGEEGAQAWKALAGDRFMPDRWVAKTGRGLHLWVADIEPWPTTKLGEKLDFKGVGGYVAAPPSMHPDGHRYEWLLPPGDEPPLEMPDPLRLHLVDIRAAREAALVNKQMRRQVPVEDRDPNLIYADVSFDGIIESVSKSGEGNRNNLLFWAAATMAEDGASEEDFDSLLNAAAAAGLPRWEARRTIKSAMNNARV